MADYITLRQKHVAEYRVLFLPYCIEDNLPSRETENIIYACIAVTESNRSDAMSCLVDVDNIYSATVPCYHASNLEETIGASGSMTVHLHCREQISGVLSFLEL